MGVVTPPPRLDSGGIPPQGGPPDYMKESGKMTRWNMELPSLGGVIEEVGIGRGGGVHYSETEHSRAIYCYTTDSGVM